MSSAADLIAPAANFSQVEKLRRDHLVKKFKSGEHSLDQFLARHALTNQDMDSSPTYVVHRNGSVVGYYSLTAGSVNNHADCLPTITENMPSYPIPVILLARLAVDRTEQRRGLAGALMKDAFARIVSAAEIVGARALLVHAINPAAAAFYEHFDFEVFPKGTLQLMISIKDIRAGMMTEMPAER